MKLTAKFIPNLKIAQATKQMNNARDKGLLETIVAIANEVIKTAPPPPRIGSRYISTGHNRRSIAYKVGSKVVATGTSQADEPAFIKEEPGTGAGAGAVYSTSGYGGYLETGTSKMGPRPYFKPALDKNLKNLPKNIKVHVNRGGI